MNLRSLASLSCRLLALITAVGVIHSSSALLIPLSYALSPNAGTAFPVTEFLLQLAPIATLILVSMILWMQADHIGARMVDESDESLVNVPKDQSLQALAFSVMGLHVLTGVLPRLAQQIIVSLTTNSASANTAYPPPADIFVATMQIGGWVSLAVELALGLWLLFGARGLVFLLANIRHIGRNRESLSEESQSADVPLRPEN